MNTQSESGQVQLPRLRDEVVAEAAVGLARDELDLLDGGRGGRPAIQLWDWICRAENRGLLKLWVDAYARSLTEPDGPWGDFAATTVRDWLRILGDAGADADRATATLALLRGALLDLLATGEVERTTRAVRTQLERLA